MKSFLLSTALLLCSLAASAQSWQWGKRGGGSSDGSNLTPYETVVDMVTDKAGNVYALVLIKAQGLPTYSTGTGSTTTGSFLAQGNTDIGIISYRCDGAFRWRRTIGGASEDLPLAIGADTLGGIYITGGAVSPFVNNSPNTQVTFEGGGPTWAHGYNKFAFIARYDTAGAFGWLRQPMPDTADRTRQPRMLDATVTPSGDVYCLAYLRPGLVGGTTNTVVTTAGVYLLRYGSTGTLLSLTPMQMNIAPQATQFISFRIARTSSGRIIAAGCYDVYSAANSFSIGGSPLASSIFVASFSSQGTLLWKRNSNDSLQGFTGRPTLDAQGNIYLSGFAVHGASFNGITYSNSLTTAWHSFPVAKKLDSTGNTIWSVNGSTNSASNTIGGVLVGSSFYIAGDYSGRLQFPSAGSGLSQVVNEGYDPYLVRINAQNGAVQSLDSLDGSGQTNVGASITADRSGNVYVGGFFSNNISIAGTTYINNGGFSDYYIAKWGTANCNCVLPTPAFNRTLANRTVTVNYTAAATGLDSVVWNWGNGQRTKVTSNYAAAVNYTYPAASGAGPFTVCATAYTSCGQNQVCQTVTITTSVQSIEQMGVVVYPNPTSDVIVIEGAQAGTSYRLMSVVGQQVKAGRLSGQQLFLGDLPAGIYLLELTNQEGIRAATRITKR